IVAGTTSGWVVEAIERTGVFKWTFPSPPQRNGPFAWHSSPAIADLDPTVSGLEVIIGNTFQGFVYALDGDNRDGVNDGITADISWYPVPGGTEGKDWDVLWIYQTGGSIISTPAIGDVDNDGCLEVMIGSADGNIYCLNGRTGLLEWKYTTGGKVDASPALADFELDGDLEVVIGSADGKVYFIDGDENGNGIIDASEVTFFSTEGAVYSSAALGDVDNDGNIEVIVGSSDFKVYSFDYNPTTNTVALNWFRATGGPVVSSPALADRTSVGVYDKDWPMFRNNPERTGFYGPAPSGELDIYVGSDDSYLYLLDGHTGAVIDRFQTYGPIHTSPSVADVDGDEHLEIAFYDWGYDWGYDDTFWLLRDTVSPGFYLNASPDQNTVAQGGDVTYDITASSYNNFADPITFDIFGLPPNTFSTFTPNPATPLPNGSVVTVLRVTTTIDTPPGEYMLFIRGVSGAKERTITVALVTVTGSDFAVDASPSQITISKGQSANFDVNVTSLAGFSSSVTLTVSGTPLSASASFSPNPVIPPPNGMVYSTLTVSTTSATPPGTYNLYVNGTSGSLVRRIPLLYRTLVVVLPVHDVAVTNVAPSKTVVGQGYSLNINVTAANQGDYTETFNVTAYANTTIIASQAVTLTSGNSTTLTFTWNTTGFAYAYTIGANATILPGETSTSDNTFVDGLIKVSCVGDLNGDYITDGQDYQLVKKAVPSSPGSPNWNQNADLNDDGLVDGQDFQTVKKNIGQSAP
ncbi:PQQ-binding-like beta-propeller repeat protein, partial [Candidatus Bathyarchaeota archaeon]|nr:PQQ-binding-like beta-propeller repeat protein [Candidatus Bathyarchaeota archaeon]